MIKAKTTNYRINRREVFRSEGTFRTSTNQSIDLYAPPRTGISTLFFSIIVIALLSIGWHLREEEHLVPESGIGYALGIAGSVLMLLLMLYPLRKKVRFMRHWGPTRYWFKVHMIMGIIGPLLIIFHSNFRVGSLNSGMALLFMLMVTVSGIVGRYIYTRIHYGLYGKRESLKELKKEIEPSKNSLRPLFNHAPKIEERLSDLEATVLTSVDSLSRNLWRLFTNSLIIRWRHLFIKLCLRRALKVTAKNMGWRLKEQDIETKYAKEQISAYIRILLKISEFGFYERLFALWHMFHLPLFIMLVISAVIHVLFVHMY